MMKCIPTESASVGQTYSSGGVLVSSIVTKDSTFLDREYTVFGSVTEGMDVADKIVSLDRDQNDCPLEDAKMVKVSISE